jgi:glutathione S-transferase
MYELFYWPNIQGRGEFVRLAFEEAGVPYLDVAREPRGMVAMRALLAKRGGSPAPFAPPFIRTNGMLVAQTAVILDFIAPRIALVPRAEAKRVAAHQLQLTVMDLVTEVHDTHHPISVGLYYRDQKREARRRTTAFLAERAPKFFGYFERQLASMAPKGPYLFGSRPCYVDLSLFQVVEGLRYAFPSSMRKLERSARRLVALHDRVAERRRIKSYICSPRRLPFNEDGIFRHYPELDREE